MCGRYTLSAPKEELLSLFRLADFSSLTPRYNIAPSQEVPIIRHRKGENILDLVRWGLIPSWSQTRSPPSILINARSESVDDKPSFKSAFRKRRCLVPASGFYEWPRSSKRKAPKQPYYIGLTKWKPFAMAGIWEEWQSPSGELVESCSILTTKANDTISPFHHRMPVILEEKDYAKWLNKDSKEVHELLSPYAAEAMQAVAVSTYVNNVRNDDPSCIRPAPVQQKLF